VSVHDGYTLNDVVSYSQKHNLANGENNRDGRDGEMCANYGTEGPTDDTTILGLRQRVRRAMLATLLLSQGTPMLCAGDELGNSQQGNNNAYCQDNAINWIAWTSADSDLTGFAAQLLALRKQIPALAANRWWSGQADIHGVIDVEWLSPSGTRLEAHDWDDPAAKALMIRLSANWLILVNGYAHQVRFHLPPGKWNLRLESAGETTTDTTAGTTAPEYTSAARSVAVLARDSAVDRIA
jgi:glycogen operon protein